MGSSYLQKSVAASALSLSLIVIPLSALPASAQEAIQADTTSKTVTLLNINDFHGRISMDIGMGLAGTIEAERAKNPEGAVLLSAGDNVSASLFVSSIQHDTPTLKYLNALGLQASAVGNHEFDGGFKDLTNRVEKEANFPYLGANVIDKATGKEALKPYTIITTKNGVKIGVIGTVTQQTPELTDPSALANLNFTDPVAATNKYADMLKDGNPDNGEVDVVVAEYHEGVNKADPKSDPIVTKTDKNVDVIFTGHTHEEYVFGKNETGIDRPVLQTGNYGDNLGEINLTVANGKVSVVDSKLVKRGETPTADAVKADPILANVQQILTDANAYAKQQGEQKVATVSAPITTGWDAANTKSKGGFDQRDKESTMGHLVADMYLSAANSTGRTPADIGIVNPGGLRDELPHGLRTDINTAAGDVTVGDVVTVTPFANNLWTTKLTGAQLKSVLEEQWQADKDGKPTTRAYLQLGLSSNVTYTYKGTTDKAGFADRGNHIENIYVNGKKISDTDTFTVAIPSFLLGGGDNFRTLSQGTDSKDTAIVDSNAFITYLRNLKTVTPRYNKQAVKVENLASSYKAQGNLTLNVSDLNTASYKVPETTELTAAIDGKKIGTVTVKNGAADISLPLAAANLSNGAHTLTLSAPSAIGTVVSVPVTITGATPHFVDINDSTLFHTEINWAAQKGITKGWDDNTFRPTASIERGAMAAFMYRAAGSPAFTAPATPSFKDVPTDYPFYKEIEWMKAKGITTGYGDGTFRPQDAVNRDAMAAFFYRAAGKPAYAAPKVSAFKDVVPSTAFYKEISWMASSKISTGWADGTYRPLDSVHRDAMAAFLYRYANGHVGRDGDAIFSVSAE